MIRPSNPDDLHTIYEIINDSARAYKGVIPDDRWHDPYMPMEELKEQIGDGVEFYCYEEDGKITGVMGIQNKGEVRLIRHAYVRTTSRKTGIGGKLLEYLKSGCAEPILIGTWKDAFWAVSFYEKHGFFLVREDEKTILLKKYWNVPERQIETSVVLSDGKHKNIKA